MNFEHKLGSFNMLRWFKPRNLSAIAVALSVGLGGMASTDASAESVLKVIPHADLKNLDPIWTTA